ncbi:MAG: porin [Chlorobiaceae bacterium]|nr:porin [Chlorobiaceae bacterium]
MKRMVLLAAMFVVLFYISTASAAVKLGGEAAIRLRGEFKDTKSYAGVKDNEDDLKFQYRVRLKPSADLGSGYYFKGLIQREDSAGGVAFAGGWAEVGKNNAGAYNLEVSNFYFGRNLENSRYAFGRLPLGSFNNPIFDLLLYPTRPVDTPVTLRNFDRLFGFQYGAKLGDGELTALLGILDNTISDNKVKASGDGLFNDGYGLYVDYKFNASDVILEPQAFVTLTNFASAWGRVTPNTFGATASIPAGKSKISLSGFYTFADDTLPNTTTKVDYSGYLLRVKGESGPLKAWVDYNQTKDKSAATRIDYDNLFVWASYNVKLHESATGTFSLAPTLRYRASGTKTGAGKKDDNQLRTELYATVTF